ncbi:heme/hemin ABC transporter substrate-binding protein [Oceanobacter mangrovi]|uniref:heme/hemin ABC transporter substrate-binding protein n=1 Tax=Oceanobacter mangrovi TaxID=2862510 RepID=UPI001C8D6CBA|nr:ABC transporter substrate-binding protein [Oceanobacter mangrovi]
MKNQRVLRLLMVCSSLLALLPLTARAATHDQPQRVISIDGSITEIVYALDQQQQLVGVDTTSRYPAAAQQLPQVGYMRQLSVEGILSLQPDLILASEDAGPANVFEQLQQAGVTIVRTPREYSLAGVLNKVEVIARALHQSQRGAVLQQQIQRQAQQALARIPARPAPSALFLLGAGNRGLMAAGQGTQASAMLQLVQASNAVNYQGYKPLSPEGAIQAAPDVVIVGHTQPDAGSQIIETLAMTPAQQHNRVFAVDVSLMLGFGPRLPQAIDQLVDLIWYPPQQTAASH